MRGKLRDGRDVTHDTTVRPLAAIVDTQSAQEIYASRIDLDDRSQPVHVDFSPYGNFAILTLGGSNRVEIRDVNRPTQVFSAIGDVGAFPRAAVLAPDGHLFVQGALSRNVLVYDLATMLDSFAASTPPLLADIPAVASEKLPAQVLAGKKIFHDAEDTRMAFEGYMSCGACHFEGDDDGRVYDFSTRGEGLRNTPALLGRKGTRTRPPELVGHARRGAGLRASDPRAVRRHRVPVRRRLPRRDTGPTARRCEGRPERGPGRSGRVRDLARSRRTPAPTATRTVR